jgi:hypothetical protein
MIIKIESTSLCPSTFSEGVQFDFPIEEGKWVTVAQFCHLTSEVPADRFFLREHETGEQREIGYREFKRTVGSFIGKSIAEAMVEGVTELEDSSDDEQEEKLNFKLLGITCEH